MGAHCETCTCTNHRFKIMIDPGHGGIDGGAVGVDESSDKKFLEKDFNLTLALMVEKILLNEGHEVIMTRRADVYRALWSRTNQENSAKPDCFISLHMDSGKASACGANIWLHHLAPKTYGQWAHNILEKLSQWITSNRAQALNYGFRGNPQADYHVNRETKSPSMLIEVGFVTNEKNRQEVTEHLQEIAEDIVSCTIDFLRERDNIDGQSKVQESSETN